MGGEDVYENKFVMKFSVLSWNIEHFNGESSRLAKVAAHIKADNPDIFGLLEIEKVSVLELLEKHFPEYDFGMTDGPEVQEILVGWRRAKFLQAVFTQKREFKAYNPALRPGALLSVRLGQEFWNLLFLHTDSGTDAPAFGNRAEMFGKIWKVREALRKRAGEAGGRLLVLGDLNTMGLRFPSRRVADRLVSGGKEVEALRAFAGEAGMYVAEKSHDATYGGVALSDLDHLLATKKVKLRQLGQRPDRRDFHVRVRGWQQLNGSARKTFIETVSDHCSLYAEVEG